MKWNRSFRESKLVRRTRTDDGQKTSDDKAEDADPRVFRATSNHSMPNCSAFDRPFIGLNFWPKGLKSVILQ
jgi:hypothetical protein